jgi:terpene synthase-like protein
VFDWRSIASELRPGRDSESQRRQAARAQAIEPLLRTATAPFVAVNAPFERYISQSVFFATACAPQTILDEDAALLAYLIWWIFITDTYVDQQDRSFLYDSEQVEHTLLSCLPPLVRRYGENELRRIGWPSLPKEDADKPEKERIFSGAFEQWLKRVAQRGVGLRRIARQIARCIGSMRQEFAWSCALSQHAPRSRLPTLDQYLLVAARTTGLHPTAAFVASLAPLSGQAYRRAWLLVEHAAPIIRLANDLASVDTDGMESHFTALQAAHFEREGALALAHGLTTEDERRARSVVASALQRRLRAFAASLEDAAGREWASTDALSQFVTRTLATSLAAYGDGSDYVTPDPLRPVEPPLPAIGADSNAEYAPFDVSLEHVDQPIAQ